MRNSAPWISARVSNPTTSTPQSAPTDRSQSRVAIGDGRGRRPAGGSPLHPAGATARVDLLTQPDAPVAQLSSGTAADTFGAFSYRYSADGTITPDPAWVQDNIRTETVPVFGRVTCHRLMLPQLRGALQEVAARGGRIILIGDAKGAAEAGLETMATMTMPDLDPVVAPIVYAVPIQLIAYHTAVFMGKDVDQPRNLAKSVTVE